MQHNGDNARDDDGVLLLEDTVINELEVAHILPHSLMKADADRELVHLPCRIYHPSSGIPHCIANVRLRIHPSKRHSRSSTCLTPVLYT